MKGLLSGNRCLPRRNGPGRSCPNRVNRVATMPTAQNFDTDRCRHIQAHIGTHTAHTVHIEAHGGITHTANSQAEERTDLARVPILPSVHQTRKGPIWRRWLFFLRGLLGPNNNDGGAEETGNPWSPLWDSPRLKSSCLCTKAAPAPAFYNEILMWSAPTTTNRICNL